MTPPAREEKVVEPDRTSAHGEVAARRVSRGELVRRVAAAVLLVLSLLFAALNLDTVEINWIFVTGNSPLIVVILTCLLVGIALGLILTRRKTR